MDEFNYDSFKTEDDYDFEKAFDAVKDLPKDKQREVIAKIIEIMQERHLDILAFIKDKDTGENRTVPITEIIEHCGMSGAIDLVLNAIEHNSFAPEKVSVTDILDKIKNGEPLTQAERLFYDKTIGDKTHSLGNINFKVSTVRELACSLVLSTSTHKKNKDGVLPEPSMPDLMEAFMTLFLRGLSHIDGTFYNKYVDNYTGMMDDSYEAASSLFGDLIEKIKNQFDAECFILIGFHIILWCFQKIQEDHGIKYNIPVEDICNDFGIDYKRTLDTYNTLAQKEYDMTTDSKLKESIERQFDVQKKGFNDTNFKDNLFND